MDTQVVQELADELYEDIDAAYEDLVISPGVALKPRERLQRYLTLLGPTWTVDMPLLLEEDYVALYKRGLAPPIMAMPWAALQQFPRIFERIRKDFVHLYDGAVKEMLA